MAAEDSSLFCKIKPVRHLKICIVLPMCSSIRRQPRSKNRKEQSFSQKALVYTLQTIGTKWLVISNFWGKK